MNRLVNLEATDGGGGSLEAATLLNSTTMFPPVFVTGEATVESANGTLVSPLVELLSEDRFMKV
jgi:hypothetical protein